VNITLDDGSYYLGMWYVPPDERLPEAAREDFLLACWRPQPGAAWEVEFRVRAYADDTKRWGTAQMPPSAPEAALLARFTLLAGEVGTRHGVAPITVLIQGDGRAALAALRERLAGYATFTEEPPP